MFRILYANLIPWDKVENAYLHYLKDVTQGNKALPVQKALGSLLIKERMNWSNEEAVEKIKENPYLQYFIGLSAFQEKVPFVSFLITHFCKQLDECIHHSSGK
ncbi:transposase [Gracilibacillus timonensis]|uniref:transposase n=1 Tax=Gracilibacillus timonensis TaxID=1816696 RepID=UPI001372649F|nr:transposase [Gracilibacillus timonensis]